jgi:hypothetical protein
MRFVWILILATILGCNSVDTGNAARDTGNVARDLGQADLANKGDAGAVDASGDGGSLDSGPRARPMRVDGLFDDWIGVMVTVDDPRGDTSSVFDLARVSAKTEDSLLFLRVRLHDAKALNLQNGPASEGTLRLLVSRGSQRISVDFRARAVTGPQGALEWHQIAFRAAPTVAAKEFELRLDTAALGVKSGDEIEVDFAGNDALTTPMRLRLDRPRPPATERDAARQPGTSFRVISLNTYRTGLLDSARAPAIGRMLAAMKGDILCFQEEFRSTATDIKAQLDALDPLGDQRPFTVHKSASNLIVTSLPLRPLPSTDGSYAMAAVDVDGKGRHVVVLSIRPNCCGYIESPEDLVRIGQVRTMVDAIASLRAGTLPGAADLKAAPVIVIGDWNHVGSNTPLELMTAVPR